MFEFIADHSTVAWFLLSLFILLVPCVWASLKAASDSDTESRRLWDKINGK